MLNVKQCFSTREGGNCAAPPPRTQGHWSASEDVFADHSVRGATGIYWVEVKDAAHHPTCTRQFPLQHSYLAQNVHSAKVEKPWFPTFN